MACLSNSVNETFYFSSVKRKYLNRIVTKHIIYLGRAGGDEGRGKSFRDSNIHKFSAQTDISIRDCTTVLLPCQEGGVTGFDGVVYSVELLTPSNWNGGGFS
jgi:hypothetical protein